MPKCDFNNVPTQLLSYYSTEEKTGTNKFTVLFLLKGLLLHFRYCKVTWKTF